MTLVGHLIGGTLLGVGVRCYSLGLQIKPIFSKPSVHLAFGLLGGSLGYYLHNVQLRQNLVIEKRRLKLQERKEKRMQEYQQSLS